MANTFALGGSPLGLINVKSRPTRTGMSTFNGGKSRNMNVFSYNRGAPQPTGTQIGGKESYAAVSLMSGGNLPNFFPNADIGKIGSDHPFNSVLATEDKNGQPLSAPRNEARGVGVSSDLHNDAAYDTSLLNIIERLSKTSMGALRPQDFAYCKFLGVFPNNRLMIARRFPSPVGDSIFGVSSNGAGSRAKSVLISWKKESEDFLEFTFGEEWMDADADFTNLLNKLGKDFGIDGAGNSIGAAFNLIPLPNFTETLQKEILVKMGVLDRSALTGPLPSGNPNIIKMAKRRKTIGYGEAGAGLRCVLSVVMACEYEQKFISGIDPTTAFQDIINNILIFGTSNSSGYGMSAGFANKIKQYATNPNQLIVDVVNAIKGAVEKAIQMIKKAADKLLAVVEELLGPKEEKPVEDTEREDAEKQKKLIENAQQTIKKFFNSIKNAAYKTISKYKIEIIGIANALSGAPSAPWHITLGNPLRPFFCSGDMLCGDVSISFGPMLAFNDLPSSVKASFTLTNARPLGMQEILAKFNSGSLRTVNVKKDFVEAMPPDFKTGEPTDDVKALIALNNGQYGSYFDGVYDKDRNLISAAPKGLSTSSSGPQIPTLGLQPDGTLNVETIILITSTGPGGVTISSFTTSIATLKDLGTASVALLDPEVSGVARQGSPVVGGVAIIPTLGDFGMSTPF